MPEIKVPLACNCIGNCFLLVTTSIEHISLLRRGIRSYIVRFIRIYPTHALYDNIRHFMCHKFRLLYTFCCQLMYLIRKFYFVLCLQTKVKSSLPTSGRCIGEAQVWLHSFLTWASVNFTPWPPYSREERRYPLNRRLRGPPDPKRAILGKEKNLLPLLVVEPRIAPFVD